MSAKIRRNHVRAALVCVLCLPLTAAHGGPAEHSGVHFREDFEGAAAGKDWKRFADEGRRSVVKIATLEDGVPLPKGDHALSVSGEGKWNGASLTLRRGVPLTREVLLKCNFWTDGAADTIGFGVAATGKGFTHYKVGPARVKRYGKWATAIWRLNDYYPEHFQANPERLVIDRLRFVQRVSGGHEKPKGGGALHRLVIDNIVIASGKAADPIRKTMNDLAGQRTYTGRQCFAIPGVNGLVAWHAPSTATVFERQPAPRVRGQVCRIAGARNEYESLQLVLRSRNGVGDLSVAPSEFVGPQDAKIPAAGVRWHPVCYLPIRSRYVGLACADGASDQRWPGPLSWNRTFSLKPNVNQPVWVTVHIPKGIPAGEYRGHVDIRRGERSLGRVPVAVMVWNFDFPDRVTFRTNIQVWTSMPNPWDKRGRKEGRAESGRLLAAYHMFDAGNFIRYSRALREELVGRVSAVKLPFCGGHRGGRTRKVTEMKGHAPPGEEYEKALLGHLARLEKRLKPLGVWDRSFLYVWDEPFGDFDVVKLIQYISGIAKKRYPKLKTLVAAPYYEEFDDTIDIFLAGYSASERRKKALAKGKEFWWWANAAMYIDMPAIDARMAWGLESVQKGLSGAYAWGVFVLKRGARGAPNTPKERKWPFTDPWRLPPRDNYSADVIWPGGREESKPQRLVPSIALELLRDGIEDYEYVVMLRAKAKALAAKGDLVEAEKAKRLLARSQTLYKDPRGVRADFRAVDELTALRAEIAELLAR